ncbi:MAG TPA: EAL domain-containing protein, partial [Longimicrobiaceae bacterium]|nr:EAL domain-containing protein [Longimicrobiaceae bacterium]
VLEDARRSRRARETRAVRELGARAYAGVPLRAPNGTVVGCACALDTRPREWSGADAEALEGVAAGVEADLARRLAERALADREAIHRGDLELARERAAENEERAGHGGRASGEEVHAGLAGWPATEAELGRAVERDELRLLYQPVVSLRTGRVAGFEAQLRWEHPRLGTLHPAGFLPLAEATGLAVPVGAWALRESCRSLRGWRRAFPGAPVGVSVGLSARELRGGGLVERVRRALEETGNEPGSLRLQVAEGAAARGPEEAAALHALRELGVQLHLDGFGTGCSSLTRLHRLPLDALKVDRSCVCALDRDPAAARLVRSAVPLAHALGLAVVADGVETASALDLLRGLRCEYAQGPHLSPPLDGDGARELLAAGVRW